MSTRCESLILHMDGGNPGAVSLDGTKKYQPKLGLVKDDKSIKSLISHKVQKHKILEYEYCI